MYYPGSLLGATLALVHEIEIPVLGILTDITQQFCPLLLK